MKTTLALLGVFTVLLFSASGQAKSESLTLAQALNTVPVLDTSLPRPEDVVGIGVGERHWYHHEIVRYLDALAASSPRMEHWVPMEPPTGAEN